MCLLRELLKGKKNERITSIIGNKFTLSFPNLELRRVKGRAEYFVSFANNVIYFPINVIFLQLTDPIVAALLLLYCMTRFRVLEFHWFKPKHEESRCTAVNSTTENSFSVQQLHRKVLEWSHFRILPKGSNV